MASFALWGTAESAAAALAPYDAQTRIVTTRGPPPPLLLLLLLPFGEPVSYGEEEPTTMTSLTSHFPTALDGTAPSEREGIITAALVGCCERCLD